MTHYQNLVARLNPCCLNRSSFAFWRMLTLSAPVKIQNTLSLSWLSKCQQYTSKGRVSGEKVVLHIPQVASTEYTQQKHTDQSSVIIKVLKLGLGHSVTPRVKSAESDGS